MENEQKYNEQSPDNNPQVNSKIVEKAKNKSKKHKRKIVFYYSFLTFVLLFCIVQVGASVILNTSKTVAYRSKIKTMNKGFF